MQLIVRRIIGEPINGLSRVVVNIELYKLIAKANPDLPFTIKYDNGKKIRVFEINGATLYSFFSYDILRPMFFLDTAEAQKRYQPLPDKSGANAVSIGLASFLEAAKTQPLAVA